MTKLFYVYTPEDKVIKKELEAHLSPLIRAHMITIWGEREIQSGLDWHKTITSRLETADLIVFMISPSFMASNYMAGSEMYQILESHKRGDAYVLPILIGSVDWTHTPLNELQIFPPNGKPLSMESDPDNAFSQIVQKIREVILLLQTRD